MTVPQETSREPVLVIRCIGADGRCRKPYALLDGETIRLAPNRCHHLIELREVVNGEWRLKPFVADALLAALASDRSKSAELLLQPRRRDLRKHPGLTQEEEWADFAEGGDDDFGSE